MGHLGTDPCVLSWTVLSVALELCGGGVEEQLEYWSVQTDSEGNSKKGHVEKHGFHGD